MIVKDRKDWLNAVVKRFASLTFQQTKHSKIAYAGGRMVAVYDYKQERGMIL